MEPVTSSELLADVTRRAQALRERIGRLTSGLRPDQLLWQPHRGWSIGQIVEHLLVADSLYQDRLRQAIARGRERQLLDRGEPWRPTLAGRWLVDSFDPGNRRRLPAPTRFAPTLRPRPSVVPSYLSVLDELLTLLREAGGLDLRRLRFGSPVTGLIRLNAGDGFLVLANHGARHAGQIERVHAEAGFPAS